MDNTKFTFIVIYTADTGQTGAIKKSLKFHLTPNDFLVEYLNKWIDYDSTGIYFDDSTDLNISVFRENENESFLNLEVDGDSNPLGISRKIENLK